MFGALLIVLLASATAKEPTFKTNFQSVTLEAGQWVHLLCTSEGEEPITYRWYNQTQDEVTTRDNKELVYVTDWANDSSLVFKNLSSENEGSYTCTARNAHGMISKVFLLTVTPPRANKPTFRKPFENVTLEAGLWVQLLCTAEGEEPITYRWYNQAKDEITTRDDKQHVYVMDWATNNTSLVFKNLSTEDEGSYTCTASNAYGLASTVYFLTVPPPSGKKPTFKFPSENVTLEAGRWVSFSCTAQGDEPITYKWYNKTGHEIQDGSSLDFKNLSSENEGSYTCIASNAYGWASKIYSLTVPPASAKNPTFKTPFENVTLEAGRNMVYLLCAAQGEEPITYRWYNETEDEVTTRDKNQLVYVQDWPWDSLLVFKNLSTENEGSYTCTASNDHGLAKKVFSLKVPPPSEKIPTFKTPFQNVTLDAGRWVHLLCAAQGEEPITYRWYNQTEDEVTTRDRNQSVYVTDWARDSSLVFKNLSSEDEGTYTCIASNDYGQASKVYSLTVPPPIEKIPTFKTPFENKTLHAGRWVHLLCAAQGEEPITYRWYNQTEDEVTTRDRNQLVYVVDWAKDSSLVFKNLSSENEGSYTCTASNVYGLASKVYSLTVPPPSGKKPTFKTPFENVTLEAGRNRVYLLCAAEGEEPITYRWYNQTKDEVTTRDRNQLVYVEDWSMDSMLVFKNLSSENEGWYTCTASNVYGLASKVYFLTVPPPSDGNDTGIDIDAKVLKYTDKSVTFYITTSGPAQYIEAKYMESNGSSNATIKRFDAVPGNNSYEIGDLLPSGVYRFQFRTVPSESNKWSREYRVILLPDVPEIIFESFCNRSIKLQLFAKADNVSRGTIDKHQIKYFPVKKGGNSWTSMNCSVTTTTTEVSTCVGSSYTIWGLEQKILYQIEVRAHTAAGYGQPWRQKVYVP